MHEHHAADSNHCSFLHRSQTRGPWGRPSSNWLLLYIKHLFVEARLEVMKLLHPYFVHRRSRASGHRRPCSSTVWSTSRVGTPPLFFQGGAPLCQIWTVHQCWCSTSTVDSFSFWIWLLFLTHILRLYSSSFSSKEAKTLLVFSL